MISIVMPAYNVEKYIAEAIDSIIAQTYKDWELIVVDDCSKDLTCGIVEQYVNQYPNIKFIRRKENSGGCRLPRFDGILAAQGEFVCPIDSDDFIEPEYLQKMVQRQKETGADIVLGRMVFCGENGEIQSRSIPSFDYDMSMMQSGKEVCKLTIGGWDIAMGGLLANTNLYKNYIKENYTLGQNYFMMDEVDHRRFLYTANVVSMIDARYYYRQQVNSIVHSKKPNYFLSIEAAKSLYNWVIAEYGNDNNIIEKLKREYVEKVYRLYILYFQCLKEYSFEDRLFVENICSEAYNFIKIHDIVPRNKKHWFISKSKLFLNLLARIVYLYGKIRK